MRWIYSFVAWIGYQSYKIVSEKVIMDQFVRMRLGLPGLPQRTKTVGWLK
jgi:hypothetical protein